MYPVPSLLRLFFCFAENVGSLKTQICGKKNNNEGSAEAHWTRAKIQGLTLKNGVDIGVWRNLGFYAVLQERHDNIL